jgi:hypothetical protein
MRLLLVGDIVGRPGKHACSQVIPQMIRDRQVDFVVANAENASDGSGLTPSMYTKLRHYGVDVCTMGDHIYRRREIMPLLNSEDRLVRPANFAPEAAGRQVSLVEARGGGRVAVISLLGRTFMNVRSDCPYHAADRVLATIPHDVRIIVVDMHAETTSEKIAMGWHLDGRASVVFGTHTHVQTADERILPKGTAYITDIGMTGPHDSVLGRDKHAVLRALVTGMPTPYVVAKGDARLQGVIVDVDNNTGRATLIERVNAADPEWAAVADNE